MKLLHNFLGFLLWELYKKTLWGLNIIGCNEEMRIVRGNFHDVKASAYLFASFVEHNAILIQDACLPYYSATLCQLVPSSVLHHVAWGCPACFTSSCRRLQTHCINHGSSLWLGREVSNDLLNLIHYTWLSSTLRWELGILNTWCIVL